MDIEGARLEGAEHTLQIAEKVVVVAYHVRDGQKTSQRVAALLKNYGFKVLVDEDDIVYVWKDL